MCDMAMEIIKLIEGRFGKMGGRERAGKGRRTGGNGAHKRSRWQIHRSVVLD